ncbi:RNA 2',3'-cyclic phosphodiesterase [Aliiglaciecola litoralis]|uniref:RNA 2',3'-cyclic phosphodiesterase n=1 Tax=Aliiglaciecola litoralis TaxID=582857 RepID=A0ABP3WRB2_9ALTE
MRYFLGFDLAVKSKLDIDAWRHKSLPSFEAAVPASNFHITAVFLGQITDRQLEMLSLGLDELTMQPQQFSLDMMGYWSKPKILWLGCTNVNDSVYQLYTSLIEVCKKSTIELPNRDYKPHVTLVRKVSANPPAALLAPNFVINVDKLHLFESVSGKQGVHYPIRQSWEMRKPIRPKGYS